MVQPQSSAHAHRETRKEGCHAGACIDMTSTRDQQGIRLLAYCCLEPYTKRMGRNGDHTPMPSNLFQHALSMGRRTRRWGLDGFWVSPLPPPAARHGCLCRF